MTRRAPFKLYEKGVISANQSFILGQKADFRDVDYLLRDSGGVAPTLSDADVVAILVANANASNLLPGQIVKWDTGATYGPLKGVNVLAGTGEHAAGVISPFIPAAGVAQHQTCWLIVAGPTYIQYDGSANINAKGLKLIAAASGRSRLYVAGTDEPTNMFGISLQTKTSGSAGDFYRALVNFGYTGA